MEPDAELPDDFQCGEGRPVVAGEGMVGGVAGAADLAEDLVNLGWEDAMVAEAEEEFVLAILRTVENADVRCGDLGEEFRELAEFEQAGVGSSAK
jgi:hypothetical protein